MPDGIPLVLSDVRIDPPSAKFSFNGLTYVLRNNGPHPLVAYEVWWDVYFGSKVRRMPQESDGWIAGQILAPGQEQSLSLNVRGNDPNSATVNQVVGTIAFAEFGDGTRLGPDVKDLSPDLAYHRTRALEVYSKLLNTYHSEGEQEVARILSSPAAMTGDLDSTWAWSHLTTLYKEEGMGGVLTEIQTRLAHAPGLGVK